jgi:lipase chaperone LimK
VGWRAFVVCAAALAALWLFVQREPVSAPRHVAQAGPTGRMATTNAPARATSRLAAPQATAASDAARIALLRARLARSSLRGAEPDGEVGLDASGRAAADESLRRLFDHFLSLTGEFTPDEIERLLRDEVERRHGAAIADQVHVLFARYVSMRGELASMALSDDLATRFAQLRAVRRAWFGDDAARLFADEDRHTEQLLERAAVLRDPTLGREQRDARLEQIDAARPAAQRRAEQDATSALLVEAQTRQFEQSDTDPAARAADRSALWGEDAARRLAALDRERERWDQRVAAYRSARDLITSRANLTPSDRANAIGELRRASFGPNERRRIESLEAIGALRNGGG